MKLKLVARALRDRLPAVPKNPDDPKVYARLFCLATMQLWFVIAGVQEAPSSYRLYYYTETPDGKGMFEDASLTVLNSFRVGESYVQRDLCFRAAKPPPEVSDTFQNKSAQAEA
ncbi:MAG: hypothetical protein ACR2JB_04040 [Bryobacteraceae bacterium]